MSGGPTGANVAPLGLSMAAVHPPAPPPGDAMNTVEEVTEEVIAPAELSVEEVATAAPAMQTNEMGVIGISEHVPAPGAVVEGVVVTPVVEAPPAEGVVATPVVEMPPADGVVATALQELPAEGVVATPVEELPAEGVVATPVEEPPAEGVVATAVVEMPPAQGVIAGCTW